MTSPVGAFFTSILAQVTAGNEFAPVVDQHKRRRMMQGLFENYYEDVNADVVFDTNRMWTAKLPALLDMYPNAKVIACVRNIAWVMDSIERIYRNNPYEHTRLFGNNLARTNVYNRLETLALHDQLVGFSWAALREAFYGEYAKSLLIVDYDYLAQAPAKVMPLIYQFLEEPLFEHDFENLDYSAPDFDLQLGTPGLHTVRPKIEFKQRRTIIPPDLFEKYSLLSFWGDTNGSAANVIAAKPMIKAD